MTDKNSPKKIDWDKIVSDVDKHFQETRNLVDKNFNQIIANGKKRK